MFVVNDDFFISFSYSLLPHVNLLDSEWSEFLVHIYRKFFVIWSFSLKNLLQLKFICLGYFWLIFFYRIQEILIRILCKWVFRYLFVLVNKIHFQIFQTGFYKSQRDNCPILSAPRPPDVLACWYITVILIEKNERCKTYVYDV